MMNNEIWLLAGTAASLGFIHTLIGPDHYIPFIAMSRARHWAHSKTLMISFLCGLGHVLSSGRLERYSHALAGAVIFISGISVQFLGL